MYGPLLASWLLRWLHALKLTSECLNFNARMVFFHLLVILQRSIFTIPKLFRELIVRLLSSSWCLRVDNSVVHDFCALFDRQGLETAVYMTFWSWRSRFAMEATVDYGRLRCFLSAVREVDFFDDVVEFIPIC